MSAVLLDTHAWIWGLMDSTRLGDGVKTAILEADAVHVSPISVYEIVRKARPDGRWICSTALSRATSRRNGNLRQDLGSRQGATAQEYRQYRSADQREYEHRIIPRMVFEKRKVPAHARAQPHQQ